MRLRKRLTDLKDAETSQLAELEAEQQVRPPAGAHLPDLRAGLAAPAAPAQLPPGRRPDVAAASVSAVCRPGRRSCTS